jgi:thymidylate kinase
LWFALQRAIVLENPPVMPNGGRPLVVILDRWVWSNAVAAATSPQTRMQYAIWGTTEGEKAGISRDVKTILLTAPLDVLLARHVARGEAAPGRLAELHQEYQVLARNHGWPVISTDCPGVAASDSIYKIVMGWL